MIEDKWSSQVKSILQIESAYHRAYFRLRERLRKKEAQLHLNLVELGYREVVYLGERILKWERVEIALNDMLIRSYFEGIGREDTRQVRR